MHFGIFRCERRQADILGDITDGYASFFPTHTLYGILYTSIICCVCATGRPPPTSPRPTEKIRHPSVGSAAGDENATVGVWRRQHCPGSRLGSVAYNITTTHSLYIIYTRKTRLKRHYDVRSSVVGEKCRTAGVPSAYNNSNSGRCCLRIGTCVDRSVVVGQEDVSEPFVFFLGGPVLLRCYLHCYYSIRRIRTPRKKWKLMSGEIAEPPRRVDAEIFHSGCPFTATVSGEGSHPSCNRTAHTHTHRRTNGRVGTGDLAEPNTTDERCRPLRSC